MVRFVDIFIPLVLIYIYILYSNRVDTEVTFVKSNVDNKEYLVRNLEDRQEAADMLASLVNKIKPFIRYIKNKHSTHEGVDRLFKKYNPNTVSEGSYDTRYTTYTLNKGEKMVYCLRNRGPNQNLHRENLIMFVTLHELGHIMSKSVHHTDEFKDNFKFIMDEAVKFGIYKPENFRKNSVNYCGLPINDTPLGDEHFTWNK